ncbi:hypothetical protein CK203_049126 [Vitis vinifera]|uniref:Uncharacterized protein n=1 Tax=Vitis vinifera TaxID=29760 RepID=A0A438HC63_VITVI|nr:hypothetical protein CK203_049126 [Vitis vinifera]
MLVESTGPLRRKGFSGGKRQLHRKKKRFLILFGIEERRKNCSYEVFQEGGWRIEGGNPCFERPKEDTVGCILKKNTAPPHHALRFHASPKVPTWLQVEEELTIAAPSIENQPHHSFDGRFNTHLHLKEISNTHHHLKEIHLHGCHLEKDNPRTNRAPQEASPTRIST